MQSVTTHRTMIVCQPAYTMMYVRTASVGAPGSTLEIALPISPVEGGEDHRRNGSMLTRIAVALDVPEQAFLDDPPTAAEFDGTVELLRIWHDLEHATDRRKLLAYAKALIAGQR